MILAGDVGGTKTALALFEREGAGLTLTREATLASRDFDSLEAAIDHFLDAGPRGDIAALCIGIAGPVVDGRCVATNLAWEVDERMLAYSLRAARARLLNDLEAAAHGVLMLGEEQLRCLQSGVPRRGNIAVIAAGTGLGEAIIVTDGVRRTVIATEGGHADFAPRGDLEEDLLRFLRREFGRVSYERVLSGPGLFNIYRFLREAAVLPESTTVAKRLLEGDPSATITQLALAEADPLCVRTLDVFVSVYGAEAGNLALKALAVGGVVITGGIAPRILARLTGATFLEAFRDKGRLTPLMRSLPVHVVIDPRAPLLGAAKVASDLL
ncbi:MAG: glucokinase [Candidatus Rokuibacteriota bacterium]